MNFQQHWSAYQFHTVNFKIAAAMLGTTEANIRQKVKPGGPLADAKIEAEVAPRKRGPKAYELDAFKVMALRKRPEPDVTVVERSRSLRQLDDSRAQFVAHKCDYGPVDVDELAALYAIHDKLDPWTVYQRFTYGDHTMEPYAGYDGLASSLTYIPEPDIATRHTRRLTAEYRDCTDCQGGDRNRDRPSVARNVEDIEYVAAKHEERKAGGPKYRGNYKLESEDDTTKLREHDVAGPGISTDSIASVAEDMAREDLFVRDRGRA